MSGGRRARNQPEDTAPRGGRLGMRRFAEEMEVNRADAR